MTYTYFANPGNPGVELTSKRGSFLDVMIRLIIIVHILFCGIVASMILYRKNFGCNIFWVILIALAILTSIMGLLAMSRDYANCNQQGEFGNLCNDYNWCNVNEIRINPDNKCPDPSPSASPALLSSLSPNTDFLGLFWTHFVLLLMEISFLIVISYYWSLNSLEIKEEAATKEEIPPPPPPPSLQNVEEEKVPREKLGNRVEIKLDPSIKSHGLLKKRK
jgi:hypothetical protein